MKYLNIEKNIYNLNIKLRKLNLFFSKSDMCILILHLFAKDNYDFCEL